MRLFLFLLILLAVAAAANEGEILRDRAGVVPVRATVAPFPPKKGRLHVTVDVEQARRFPMALLLDLPADPALPVVRQACQPTGPQRYEADLNLPRNGRWRLRVEVGTPHGNFQLVSLLDVGVSPSKRLAVQPPAAPSPTPSPSPLAVSEPASPPPASPSRAWLLLIVLAPLLAAGALRSRPLAAGLALLATTALGGALALRLWPPSPVEAQQPPAKAPVPVVEAVVGRVPFAVERSYLARVLPVAEVVVRAQGRVGKLPPVGWRVRRGERLGGVATAPQEGVVVRLYAEAGATLAAGAPLLALADDRTVRVQAQDATAGTVPAGAPVTVLDGMGAVRGRLASVQPPQAVISNRMLVIRGMAPPPKNAPSRPMFLLGQEVTLRCEVARREAAICVPRAAVAGQSVFVIEGGSAHRRAVKVGLSNDSQTEILSGLKEGEIIAAIADEDLRDGSPVAPSWATGAYRQRLQPQGGSGH